MLHGLLPGLPVGAQGGGVGRSRLDQHVVHVAVAPVFSWLEGADDRMSRVVEVLGRVLVLGLVAATYVPANQALTQMNPPVPVPEALLAALGGGEHTFPYLICMRTPLSPEHPNEPPTALIKTVEPLYGRRGARRTHGRPSR